MAMIWHDMGFIRWPIAFSTLMIAGLTFYSCAHLFRSGAWPDLRTKAFVDGILFWGAFTIVAGLLGSVVGIILTFQAIEAAGAVTPRLLAGGIKVALLSTGTGLLVLAGASLIWFGLQFRWRMLQAREER